MLSIVAIILFVVCIYMAIRLPAIAILIFGPLSILLVSTAVYSEDVAAFAFAVMYFPLVIIILCIKSISEPEPKWYHVVASGIFTVMFYILMLALAIAIFRPLGPIVFALLISFTIRYKLASRYSVAVGVISTISNAIKQNLPLPMALDVASEHRGDKQSKILRRISYWLKQGYPLSLAIKQGYRRCPADALATITAAERFNQLPSAMDSIESEILEKSDDLKKIRPVNASYPVIVLLLSITIVLGIAIFIIPTFAEVLSDMTDGKSSLPRPTQVLLDISDYATNPLRLILFLGGSASIFSAWLFSLLRPRRPQDPYITSRIGDFIKWHTPLIGWFEKQHCLIQTISLLKASLKSGCSLDRAIAGTLELNTNWCFRKRLARWAEMVHSGQDISKSARQAKISNTLAWAFDGKINKENTPSIIGMLQEYYRDMYNYRANIARSIAWPICILMLGCFVGFIVYAMYLPMIEITKVSVGLVVP